MKTKYFMFLITCVLFVNCGRQISEDSNTVFEKEIRSAVSILNTFDTSQDSIKYRPEEIHSEVDKILLLSKDIENLAASVERANNYFSQMANAYGIEGTSFISLHTGMHVDVIARTLRQNELTLLNTLIFKTGNISPILHSAQ